MTREEAQARIAEECRTKVHEGKDGWCRFQNCEFFLNLLQRNEAGSGFYFYSSNDVRLPDAKLKVRGPWLRSLIRESFRDGEYSFPNNRGKIQEGHIADFYLDRDDFDWEHLDQKAIKRISDLYQRLMNFQTEKWPANSKDLARTIQKYNEEHLAEVERYLEERKKTPNGRTGGVDAGTDKSNKKGTSDMNKEIQSLLEANLNVILTGAPGTGKTYMAKEVAKEMAKDEWIVEEMTSGKKNGKWKNGRIASVQFHPGYDYSDFVVGMKPVLISADTCKEVFRDENGIPFTTDTGKKDGARTAFFGKTEVSFRWKDGIFKKFADDAQKAFDAWVATDGHKPEDAPKFVFLIDEINRSDLSRVFGELFSLLEEEYRYPNDKGTGITLPNGEYFVIPRNLYILGTMNDIDRSVESMDFALRRRFAWYEVTAKSSMSIIDKKVSDPDKASKLKEKMKALNELIDPPQKKGEGGDAQKMGDKPKVDLRLGSEYQLGGAIFAKFEQYADRDDPFGELWSNHIENILKEYLRGRSDRGPLLAKLENVYNEKVKVTDKSVDSASGGNGAGKPSTEESATNDKQE